MNIPFDNSYARLPPAFSTAVEPTPVSAPTMIRVNHSLAAELGINADFLESGDGLSVFAGNALAAGSDPIAMAYSGHQFGGFSPQLGDGRAILLGEVLSDSGIRYDIHLKGCGQTPFSRRGDGRSALGPVIREYVVSEAMSALGVPTTRALAAVETGDKVHREGLVPGGVFTRVAQSHIRIGTFQWFAARNDPGNLRVLADHVIDRHYPGIRSDDNPYLSLLGRVIERQAELIAHWMQLGFIHGVMNTDNMTVSGETIDYGPCAFMDTYHPGKTFSSIDQQGRYSYANQGPIGHWNLTRFAEALLPLLDTDQDRAVDLANEVLETYQPIHAAAVHERMRKKIGISNGDAADWTLAEQLLGTMADGEADFTIVFRQLTLALATGNDDAVIGLFSCETAIKAWMKGWRARLDEINQGNSPNQATAIETMRNANPIYIPRNHQVEAAIQAGNNGDFSPFNRLVDVLQRPFTEQPENVAYEAAPEPDEVVHATFCGT